MNTTFKTITPQAAVNPLPKLTLESASVYVEFRPDEKQIFARCKRDGNNEPACYSTTKRGIAKCWTAMQQTFNMLTDMTHRDVMNVMTEHNVRYHYWCMMD